MGRSLPTPPASKAVKRVHERKLEALDLAKTKAYHAYLVGIYEAGEDGCTNDDIAYMVGNISPSTAGKYRKLGEEIKADPAAAAAARLAPPPGR